MTSTAYIWRTSGVHLACIDLAYPKYKVAIEYHGQFHGAQYARDIERIGRLRAAGWIVIQVSSTLVFGDLPSVLSACGRNSSTRGDVADSSARCVRMMSDQKTSQGA
jgi:very-short-patch-repair endonuclease